MKVQAEMEVYTLAELSDSAREKALDGMRLWMGDTGWITEDVSESVASCFQVLATGDSEGRVSSKWLREKYGVFIYWSVYDRGEGAWIDGTLRRSACPALAWPDGIEAVKVEHNYNGHYGMSYEVYTESGEWPSDEDDAAVKAMVKALCDRLHAEAEAEYDYFTSAEYLTENYEINGDLRRFREDGSEAPREFWSDDEEKEGVSAV